MREHEKDVMDELSQSQSQSHSRESGGWRREMGDAGLDSAVQLGAVFALTGL